MRIYMFFYCARLAIRAQHNFLILMAQNYILQAPTYYRTKDSSEGGSECPQKVIGVRDPHTVLMGRTASTPGECMHVGIYTRTFYRDKRKKKT